MSSSMTAIVFMARLPPKISTLLYSIFLHGTIAFPCRARAFVLYWGYYHLRRTDHVQFHLLYPHQGGVWQRRGGSGRRAGQGPGLQKGADPLRRRQRGPLRSAGQNQGIAGPGAGGPCGAGRRSAQPPAVPGVSGH